MDFGLSDVLIVSSDAEDFSDAFFQFASDTDGLIDLGGNSDGCDD